MVAALPILTQRVKGLFIQDVNTRGVVQSYFLMVYFIHVGLKYLGYTSFNCPLCHVNCGSFPKLNRHAKKCSGITPDDSVLEEAALQGVQVGITFNVDVENQSSSGDEAENPLIDAFFEQPDSFRGSSLTRLFSFDGPLRLFSSLEEARALIDEPDSLFEEEFFDRCFKFLIGALILLCY